MREVDDREVANIFGPFAQTEDLRRSLGALADLLEVVQNASSKLVLASNLYTSGVRSFLALSTYRGVSQLRLDAIAKALDLHTPESSLVAFLNDSARIQPKGRAGDT